MDSTVSNRVNGFPSPFSGIGGGFANCINAGGTPAQLSCFNVVAGGQSNTIAPGVCHSSILGGQNNIVNHNWSTSSGYNVTSITDCAFHTNKIVSANMPPYLGTVPGLLQYVVAPVLLGLPLGTCIVVTN